MRCAAQLIDGIEPTRKSHMQSGRQAGGWEQLTCLEGWDWEWDEDKEEEEEEDAERQRRKQLNIIIMWRGGRSRKYCFP